MLHSIARALLCVKQDEATAAVKHSLLQQLSAPTCRSSTCPWWQIIHPHLPPAASHLQPVMFKLSLSADTAVEQGEDMDPLLDAELDRVELQMTARKSAGTPAAASPGLCSSGLLGASAWCWGQ